MQNKKEKKKIVVAESSSEEESEEIEDKADDEDIAESSIDEVEDESEKDVELEVGENESDSGAEDDENAVEDGGDGEEESSEDEELKNLGNKGSKNAEINFSDKSFEELGIEKWFTKQHNEYGLTRPTPVQVFFNSYLTFLTFFTVFRQTVFHRFLKVQMYLDCKNWYGYFIAFAFPILQKLAVDPYGIFPAILTPTREMATQISDQFIALGRPVNLQVCTVTGGRDIMAQGNELSRQPHIVATPGRLADYIESDPVTTGRLFKRIQYLFLDEADQMLDGPYASQLKIIFQAMRKKRQTLLFSATITSALTS